MISRSHSHGTRGPLTKTRSCFGQSRGIYESLSSSLLITLRETKHGKRMCPLLTDQQPLKAKKKAPFTGTPVR